MFKNLIYCSPAVSLCFSWSRILDIHPQRGSLVMPETFCRQANIGVDLCWKRTVQVQAV